MDMGKGGREPKKPKQEAAKKENASQPSTKGTAAATPAAGKKGK
jgi:hypothetical protein